MAIDLEILDEIETSFKYKNSVLFSSSSTDISYQTSISGHSENYVKIVNNIPKEDISNFVSSNMYTLSLSGFKINSTVISTDGLNFYFPLENISTNKKQKRK